MMVAILAPATNWMVNVFNCLIKTAGFARTTSSSLPSSSCHNRSCGSCRGWRQSLPGWHVAAWGLLRLVIGLVDPTATVAGGVALLTLVETALHLVEELLPATATEAAAVARVLAPVTDHDETEKHTAKMRSMGYTVTRTTKGRKQARWRYTLQQATSP